MRPMDILFECFLSPMPAHLIYHWIYPIPGWQQSSDIFILYRVIFSNRTGVLLATVRFRSQSTIMIPTKYIIHILFTDCEFGDKQAFCANLDLNDCALSNNSDVCCRRCHTGPGNCHCLKGTQRHIFSKSC